MNLNPLNGAEIRRQAASIVRENRGKMTLAIALAVGINLLLQACLMLMGVTGGEDEPALVTLLSNFVTLLVSAPLQYGVFEMFIRISRGQPGRIRDIGAWFSDGEHLRTSLLGSLWFNLLTTLWLLLYTVPFAMVYGLLLLRMPQLIFAQTWLVLALVLLLMTEVILYLPGMFMLAEQPSRPIISTFSESRRGMKPFRWKFFGVYIVYALQVVACVVPLTLAVVYLGGEALRDAYFTVLLVTASLAMLWVAPRLYTGGILYWRAVFEQDAQD